MDIFSIPPPNADSKWSKVRDPPGVTNGANRRINGPGGGSVIPGDPASRRIAAQVDVPIPPHLTGAPLYSEVAAAGPTRQGKCTWRDHMEACTSTCGAMTARAHSHMVATTSLRRVRTGLGDQRKVRAFLDITWGLLLGRRRRDPQR